MYYSLILLISSNYSPRKTNTGSVIHYNIHNRLVIPSYVFDCVSRLISFISFVFAINPKILYTKCMVKTTWQNLNQFSFLHLVEDYTISWMLSSYFPCGNCKVNVRKPHTKCHLQFSIKPTWLWWTYIGWKWSFNSYLIFDHSSASGKLC